MIADNVIDYGKQWWDKGIAGFHVVEIMIFFGTSFLSSNVCWRLWLRCTLSTQQKCHDFWKLVKLSFFLA